jgi:hypothetical protein
MQNFRRIVVSALAFAAALFSAANPAHAFGLQAGYSSSPDQFVVGLNIGIIPSIAHLEIVPSAEAGFGDFDPMFGINGDVHYNFGGTGLKPYLGAGLTWNSFDGDSNFGGNAIGGLKFAGPFFAEGKVGIGDVPDFKLMAGMHF